jgi:hypothetical protein
MESNFEKRVAMKCCVKDDKTATETLEMVRVACGDETLRRSKIVSLEWTIL